MATKKTVSFPPASSAEYTEGIAYQLNDKEWDRNWIEWMDERDWWLDKVLEERLGYC